MMVLSIVAKTYAWVLWPAHPAMAVLGWLASMAVDAVAIRRKRMGGAAGAWQLAREVLMLNAAVLVAGYAVRDLCGYTSMHVKDGCPIAAHVTAFLFQSVGLPVAAFSGDLFLSTMAGPLRFSASLDNMGALIPALVVASGGVVLLMGCTSLKSVLRGFGAVVAIMIAAAFLRFVLATGLFLALCDFIGYESEELPWLPFVKPGFVAITYLPFLLLAWPLLARVVTPGALPKPPPAKPPWWRAVTVGSMVLALFVVALWLPAGRKKSGKVIINTYHSQWSQCTRPYDREWYGADSGYNYACLKRWYELCYDVQVLETRITPAVLEDASVLVIYVPDRRFAEEECRAIRAFVRRGGGLFLIGDHTNVFGSTSHLNEICRPLGFTFRDDVLFDLDEDFFQLEDMPRVKSCFEHGMTFFKYRGPASIVAETPAARTVLAVDNAKARRAIYSVNNFYPPPHNVPSMKTGRFCVAAAARFGRGRVAAFADSTIFSNFEVFYPGKYEYLLNVANWLNHSDLGFGTFLRRASLVAALLLLVLLFVRVRSPRAGLGVAVTALCLFYAARGICRVHEDMRSAFPEPRSAAQAVFFAADSEDLAYNLRAFTGGDTPYDERYDVLIQWVLRTGAFSGFYVTGMPTYRAELYEHLLASEQVDTSLALIVRGTNQLEQLEGLATRAMAESPRVMLMFSQNLKWETVADALQSAGLVTDAAALERARAAWPAGDIVIEADGRRLLLVFSAERFSDKSMGITEKVTPSPALRKRYDEAFALFDKLFEE